MNPSSGKDVGGGLPGWGQKNPNRGTVMSVDAGTGAVEVFAMGFREPNGIGVGPENEIFVPDVQGNWLPANKLIHVKKGRFYGFKHEPPETWDNMRPSPPVVFLPQGDVARVPGNPLFVDSGLYAGQMLLGDAVAGGIRRIFLEKVNGEYQGSAFFFSGGFEGGPNRILWGRDGHLYVGICGQGAPGWAFKQDFGLQKLKPNGKAAFEMLAVRSRQGGMEIEFTHEINAAAQDKAKYAVRTWHYTSTSDYGGSAQDTKTLAVSSVQVSPDRKKVFLAVDGLQAGKVVHIKLAADIASNSGNAAWTQETWYTLNTISISKPFEPTVGLPAPRTAQQAGIGDFRILAGRGRLEVVSTFAGIRVVELRDLFGSLVAAIPGHGRKSLQVSGRDLKPGIYQVTVHGDGRIGRRLVALR